MRKMISIGETKKSEISNYTLIGEYSGEYKSFDTPKEIVDYIAYLVNSEKELEDLENSIKVLTTNSEFNFSILAKDGYIKSYRLICNKPNLVDKYTVIFEGTYRIYQEFYASEPETVKDKALSYIDSGAWKLDVTKNDLDKPCILDINIIK